MVTIIASSIKLKIQQGKRYNTKINSSGILVIYRLTEDSHVVINIMFRYFRILIKVSFLKKEKSRDTAAASKDNDSPIPVLPSKRPASRGTICCLFWQHPSSPSYYIYICLINPSP